MKLGRFSLAALLRAVAVCGFGMASLLYASAPWASALYSVALGFLVVALIGIASRTGGRRAFWTGFAIAGWMYILLATGPWFHDSITRRLASTRLLAGLYPLMIPRERQPLMYDRTTSVSLRMGPSLTSVTPADMQHGVNVYVKGPGDANPALLVANAHFSGLSGSDFGTILVSEVEHARISQAFAAPNDVFLALPPAGPTAGLWLAQRVYPDQFNEAGHALFTLLFAWLGGALGRRMYATRALV